MTAVAERTCVESADSGTATGQVAGGGAIPTSTLHVRPIPWQVGRQFIRQWHYLHNAPPMGRIAFGVFADDAPLSALIGVLLYGRPAARLEEQERTLELRRMFLMDVTAKNAESRVIAITLRYIRRQMPEIERVIAYSDPSAGHDGTIYRASGFALVGETGIKTHTDGTHWLRPVMGAHGATSKRKYERRIK